MIATALTILAATSVLAASGAVVPVDESTNANATSTDGRGPPCARQDTATAAPSVIFPKCTTSPRPEKLRYVVTQGMACACDASIAVATPPPRDDYRYVPGFGGYKVHTRAATFNAARKICNEEGGYLAIVNSLAEEQILLDLLRTAGPLSGGPLNAYQALIGTHDLYAEGEWVTIHGDSLGTTGYTKWSDKWGGQPDNGGGVQHCGTLMSEGGMDDVHCDSLFAFFCERDPVPTVF